MPQHTWPGVLNPWEFLDPLEGKPLHVRVGGGGGLRLFHFSLMPTWGARKLFPF